MRRSSVFLALALAALACDRDALELDLAVYVEPELAPVLADFTATLPLSYRRASAADPAAAMAADDQRALQIAVVTDLDCAECYRIDGDGDELVVHAGDRLGAQYGLAHALEACGVRFFHPWRTYVPDELEIVDRTGFGELVVPQMRRRGLHLHTLHPIEAYYALWEPGPDALASAARVFDWIVKNRGNYVQWPALDDILGDDAKLASWRAHTGAVLELAHRRGLETGVGVQLFGASNLQQAYDLIDFEPGEGDEAAAIRERLSTLLSGLAFDEVSLSFGEFSSQDPERFIELVEETSRAAEEIAPQTEMSAVVHVGKGEDLEVEYQGETLIYYFLVRFADAAITPWVHTVMYYNLYEDAGGAYHHDDFAEHREFLLERLEAGEPVAYFPETAYWVAFDISVPTYLPVYWRSRWLDLARIREDSAARGGDDLQEHILFSSGWEWGYWQLDYLALRASHTLAADWREPLREMLAPFGDGGAALADEIAALAEAQSEALIDARLAPYLAGRDAAIDLGDQIGIVSQPDRPSFSEIAAFDDAQRAALRAEVLAPLARLVERSDAVAARVAGLELPEPWRAEMVDATAVTAARARFAHALVSAALAFGAGDELAPHLAAADRALARASDVVARRHAALHHPAAETLTGIHGNATIYAWGYLRQADQLCYWRRERIELGNLVEDTDEPVPGCLLR